MVAATVPLGVTAGTVLSRDVSVHARGTGQIYSNPPEEKSAHRALLPICYLPFPVRQERRWEAAPYLAVMMKWPRRFCCQQDSFSSVQNGCSSPLLTIVTRSEARPRLTR